MLNKLSPFLAWSTLQGINTPLQLVVEDSYRYLALPADDSEFWKHAGSSEQVNVMQVPLDACIIADDSRALAERLAYEKSLGDKSKYAPWIDMFPSLEDFQSMPRFWNPERREFVKRFDGGQLEDRMAIDQLRFDESEDPWALACADSRSNFLPDGTYSLTPMLDMFNHDPTVSTSATVDGDRQFCLSVSSSSLRNNVLEPPQDWKGQVFGFFGGPKSENTMKGRGEEVYISYGDLDNLETLCNYGFIPGNNVCNTETFKVRMMRQQAATMVMDRSGSFENAFNQITLSSLRLNLATMDELEKLRQFDRGAKISDSNELEVNALIAGELEEAIYETKAGVEESEAVKDLLVASYLKGRQATLEKGLERMKQKYPKIFVLD